MPKISRVTTRASRALIGAAFAALVALGAASAEAAKSPAAAPKPSRSFTPAFTPLGVSNAQRTYIVQLADDPITLASAAAATPFNAQQKGRLRTQLQAKQLPVQQKVRALGGRVLASYQAAYNGIKVRMAPRDIATLRAMPGVVAVRPVQVFKPNNIHGVPLVGGPAVWGGVPGLRGEGIKIADIDTGIDYTHADFGGPGTVEAYQTALATDTADPDPNLFGPGAPKIKGGTDLVGDDYNADPQSATYQPIPHPDTNPLDCNGHGTHTAGTMAGFGVLANGSTFYGPYDANTVSSHSWLVGPGVAPEAVIYAVRVFGCTGSTDVVVDAIEWAVNNDMDVINMSLGSSFGSVDSPDAVAAANAVKAGVIVVASAGNSGPIPYIVGSPSVGKGVISVAASDPTSSFPAATVALTTDATPVAIDANGVNVNGQTLPVKVLYSGTPHDAAHISLGCDPNEYTAAGVAGYVAVVKRGTCARVARAVYGQKAGAAAVLMVNNADLYPPFEGAITDNPDTGEQYTVTIPFLGVPSSLGPTLVAADGGSATLTDTTIANPGYLAPASFTSSGPRTGLGRLKPEVTAPGVSIASAGVGTGTGAIIESGTSMAAPHTTGTAALVKEAHPDWNDAELWSAAIINTADPNLVTPYAAAVAGVGLIQAQLATKTDVVAIGLAKQGTVSFGYAERTQDFEAKRRIELYNMGKSAATFAVSTANDAGSPHTLALSESTVSVPAHSRASIDIDLTVPVATMDGDVSGLVVFTPAEGSNNGVTLRVPYYLIPQAVSTVSTKLDSTSISHKGSTTATTTNATGAIPGNADWYAWGLTDGYDKGVSSDDLGAAGVQAFPGTLVFAVHSKRRWSNPSTNEFDVLIDADGDGTDDYAAVAIDYGLLTANAFDGQVVVAVFDLKNGTTSIQYLADARLDGSTILLPVDVAQLCTNSACLSESNPRFSYYVNGFGLIDGTSDTFAGTASFNAFTPAISTGMFDTVAPGGSATETVSVDKAEWKKTPALGVMVVTHENASRKEAQLIRVH